MDRAVNIGSCVNQGFHSPALLETYDCFFYNTEKQIVEEGVFEMNEKLNEPLTPIIDSFKALFNKEIIEITNKEIDVILQKFEDQGDFVISHEDYLDLLLSRKVLKDILDSFPRGIMLVDINGVIIYVNSVYLNVLDLKIEDRIGKNIFDILPDGSIVKALTNRKSVTDFMDSPIGTSVELISNAFPIIYRDKIIGAFGVMNDIQSQIKLTELLKNSTRLVKNLSEKVVQISTLNYSFEDIIANSPKMQNVIEKCKVPAKSNSIILIQGETGTGKELLAHSIHSASERPQEPFITVNCSAIPKDLLESEFFGYEKGAFTGAYKRKLGKFELANKGTLFLDEIGELNLELQPKLLRAIQEKEIQRVGGEERITIDVRIISATNRNLEEMVKKGEFRMDLYYRLNVWKVIIPPLRERKEDIEVLANYLLKKICRRLGRNNLKISYDAMIIFYRYEWPGNVRELENVIERAVIGLNSRKTIEVQDIEYLLMKDNLLYEKGSVPHKLMTIMPLAMIEMNIIKIALEKYGDSYEAKKIIARELGISLATLYNKINKYNIW